MKILTRFASIVALATFHCLSQAQVASESWNIRYNSPGNLQDSAVAMATDSAGALVVVGQTYSGSDADMWIAKFNASGGLMWSATYAGTSTDQDVASEVALDSAGNVYVAGTSGTSFALLKYNSSGVRQWVQRFQDTVNGYSVANGLALDGSGNVIITGTSAATNSAATDIVTIKYSSLGAQQWLYRYTSTGGRNEIANAIKCDSLGNVIIAGTASDALTDFDMLLLKISPTGTKLWEQRYNGPGVWDEGTALAVENGTNAIVLAGFSQGYWVTQKFTSAGVRSWTVEEPAGWWDVSPVAVGIDGTGSIVVCGYQDMADGAYLYDMGVIKYGSDGTRQWSRAYNGVNNGPDVPRGMCVEPDGDIFVVGYSAFDLDLLTSDAVLVKWKPDGTQAYAMTYNASGSGFMNPCGVASNYLGAISIGGSTLGEPGLSDDVFAVRYTEPGQFELVVAPEEVVSGQSATGQVSLASPAPSPGVTVMLSSSNSSVASVPTSVRVATGTTSITFPITTPASPTDGEVIITATALGASVTDGLVVRKQLLDLLTVAPNPVVGGNPVVGMVRLNGPAPEGGFSVSVTDTHSNVTVPSSVVVPAGQTTVEFPITTSVVSADATVTVTATNAATSKSAQFRINRTYMRSITLPANIAKNASGSGSISLNFAAPTGGLIVQLSSSDPAVTVPATVAIAAGATSKTFAFSTGSVENDTVVTVTGTAAGSSADGVTTVRANLLATLGLSSASVVGGTNVTGTLRLIMNAPSGGSTVYLSSDNPAVTMTPSVVIAAGTISKTFTITTGAVEVDTNVNITARQGTTTIVAPLQVKAPALSTLTFSSTAITQGGNLTGTVRLTGVAPTGGMVVNLASADPSKISVPSSVTVPAGALTATFQATGAANGTGSAAITATLGEVSKSVNLNFLTITITSISPSPTSARGGTTFRMTIRFSALAPAGGMVVNVGVDNPIARVVSPTVAVAAGRNSIVVSVPTTRPTTNQIARFTASLGSSSRTVQFTVTR
ncbi:MAG: SBBP repeat-containing protein [Fimbriimonadaceae bacterium]|nr:SBBP repeat-containing protein [Fimbriimonadaceae bacterium]